MSYSRWSLRLILAALWLTAATAVQAAPTFSFETVKQIAAQLARQPYAPAQPPLPPFLENLNYEQFRGIHFRPDQALWHELELPFEIQFFPRGYLFKDRVVIHTVEQGVVTPLNDNPNAFAYGDLALPSPLPKDIGYAGLRVHSPVRDRRYLDEVAVFLGASYYRMPSFGQTYGLSARGIAIDTGEPTPEEFPVFREFWIEKPSPTDTELTLYALLDGPSVTGAYRFVIQPDLQIRTDVKMHLFFRKPVTRLGIAPLTSMFDHGQAQSHHFDDFRPEVHDSDGLLIKMDNDERIWRPLVNPDKGIRFSIFETTNVRGFGILQRERNFQAYQDLEARYHDRPSAWIQPLGDWGKGSVQLVEIATKDEYFDNIVSFWTPAQPITAGTELDYEYRTYTGKEDLEVEAWSGRTIGTRLSPGTVGAGSRRFLLDFAGPTLNTLWPITAEVSTSAGTVTRPVVVVNPSSAGRRVTFELIPGGAEVIELRCYLRRGRDALTETWSYQWRRD